MAEPITFTPASSLSLEALAELFTRSFEAYFYPGVTTPAILARRVAAEDIDLVRSVVLTVGGQPAGVALLARRGARAWCAGFGVAMAHRGRGLAHALAAELIRQAREAGARALTLEVLTRNTAALRVYEAAGLTIRRRLLVLAWRPGDEGRPEAAPLEELPPDELVLGHFAALHPAPAAWQREPAALLALPDLRGLALGEGGALAAYALVSGDETGLRLADLGARDEPAARRLLAALQARAASLTSVNEPAESPLTPAFLRSGFVVADEQHELRCEL
ncbi:MAG TPA: GNAT family N-acetyltransferase [Chloroflexaceae bacterium]|nr:GNAT family N-acetyltransferase [Chloroflexaceae bacterium]